MNLNFGAKRVIEPAWAIPVAAWKLDNSHAIKKNEMRVRVKIVKLEDASFRQLCSECDYIESKIKARILDIVKKRGKIHNPATGSGGIFYGEVDEIGSSYEKRGLFKRGDKVVCITSLTAIPMCIEKIGDIYFNYGQIYVEGYAILAGTNPVVAFTPDLAPHYTIAAMEEACSLNSVYQMALNARNKCFLILSSDVLSAVLYSATIRRAIKADCRIVVALDKKSVEILPWQEINRIVGPYSDAIYVLDILAPMKSFDAIWEKEEKLFDFSINCADLMGAEAVSVLLTEKRGTVVFTSFVNNHGLGLLFAESLGKELNTWSLDAYTEDFHKFTIGILRDIKSDLEYIHKIYIKYNAGKQLSEKSKTLSQYFETGKIGDFVFASDTMKGIVEEVLNIAEYDCNVIILGETGVGKEKILSLIHNNSERRLNPCIRINCAAIPDSLAESEFFGYEAGAFTGSSAAGKTGYFELANNGILFLDEVGLLPATIQVKLLRVLQEKQFFRIGGTKQQNVNVRIVCASNISLKELVREGKFRNDLYYRLNICEINIPPLRERGADIPHLTEHFLEKYNELYQKSKLLGARSLDALLAYEWPGNVRELENVIHRVIVSSRDNVIEESEIYKALRNDSSNTLKKADERGGENSFELSSVMMCYEKQLIEDALREWKNTRKAAAKLGISQSQLMRKKQKYNIEIDKNISF